MLKEAVELLEKEWTALSSAPWAFALFSVVMFGIAFAALRWRYEGIVESFRERLETLRLRLEAKDAQLDEYRERLHLLPASGSGFSRLTHLELKQKALQFVEGLRAWLATWSAEDSRLRHQEWTVLVSAKSEEEKRKLWNQFTGSFSQRYLQLNSQYDAKFKVDSILLRDEILSRLPQGSRGEITYSKALQRTQHNAAAPLNLTVIATRGRKLHCWTGKEDMIQPGCRAICSRTAGALLATVGSQARRRR